MHMSTCTIYDDSKGENRNEQKGYRLLEPMSGASLLKRKNILEALSARPTLAHAAYSMLVKEWPIQLHTISYTKCSFFQNHILRVHKLRDRCFSSQEMTYVNYKAGTLCIFSALQTRVHSFNARRERTSSIGAAAMDMDAKHMATLLLLRSLSATNFLREASLGVDNAHPPTATPTAVSAAARATPPAGRALPKKLHEPPAAGTVDMAMASSTQNAASQTPLLRCKCNVVGEMGDQGLARQE